MNKGRKIVITLRKGGTGKTNLALNLAVYLAQAGRQVLYLDLDEQKDGFSFFEEREHLFYEWRSTGAIMSDLGLAASLHV